MARSLTKRLTKGLSGLDNRGGKGCSTEAWGEYVSKMKLGNNSILIRNVKLQKAYIWEKAKYSPMLNIQLIEAQIKKRYSSLLFSRLLEEDTLSASRRHTQPGENRLGANGHFDPQTSLSPQAGQPLPSSTCGVTGKISQGGRFPTGQTP